MKPKWLGKKLLFGAVAATALIGAIACGSAPAAAPQQAAAPQAPAAPAAPQAPQAAAPAPQAPAMQATTAPAPQAQTSAPAPAPNTGSMMDHDHDEPEGKLLIAVTRIGAPNGLPRFCSASAGGCAEIIYMSGQTETLFNSALDDKGSPTTEPMLATGFTLDPSLEFGDFKLREGVMFHNGMGEMTSEDVAFSYNDANSVTNPESVHGQAGDFAPLIASMDPVDPYTVRLQYRNYDSRGVLHRFSRFWQTAGIVSSKVYAEKGVEGMQDDYTGVGAFRVDEWVQQKHKKLTAFEDYYAKGEGNIGPHVAEIEWRDIPAGESRRAALEAGEAQIAQVALADIPGLVSDGYEAQRGGKFNSIFNIAMASGNYWEEFGALTGEPLERDRDGAGTAEFPHIGNPFEDGAYSEDTASMQSARLVRNALAWGIERESLLENTIAGLGVVNHQPYLSMNNPNYRDEWNWGTDFAMAKELLTEAGYPDGFETDMWIGTGELNSDVGEAVGAGWQDNLDVKVNLIKTEYGTFRPGLVARTNKTMFTGCGDENKANFPYDWAHGFVMSSISAGGYGVGQEIPWAAETYLQMAGEPDKAKREELSAAFYDNNRHWAMCVGVFEVPIWPAYSPDLIEEWDQRPIANGNLAGINNVRTIRLAH
ncbi:MAG: ABC transporter substrate-binding protein [Chloroflexi bacterium]|nr:ABC transporter substrate-binding protein [Chloroflexota bacterium]